MYRSEISMLHLRNLLHRTGGGLCKSQENHAKMAAGLLRNRSGFGALPDAAP
jgi:hypothetical protein